MNVTISVTSSRLFRFALQIDDQEMDMDVAMTTELDKVETLRRMEIAHALALAARDREKAVRRERMRWAVSIMLDDRGG